MSRLKELSSKCHSFTLSFNEHKVYYDDLDKYVDELIARWEPRDADQLKSDILNVGEIWEIHCYPRTPVVFFEVFGPTLESVIEYAHEVLDHRQTAKHHTLE